MAIATGTAIALSAAASAAGVGASVYGANKNAKAMASATDKNIAAQAEADRLAYERWLMSRGQGADGEAVNTKLPLYATMGIPGAGGPNGDYASVENIRAWLQTNPPSADVVAEARNTGRSVEQWVHDHMRENPQDPVVQHVTRQVSQFAQENGLPPVSSREMPAEQALFEYVARQGVIDIGRDAGRRTDAEALIASYQPQIDATRNTISSITTPTFNANDYYSRYPDISAAWDSMPKDATGRAVMPPEVGGPALNRDEFAKLHWETRGKAEGRTAPMQTQALQDSLAASTRAAQEQFGALTTQVNNLQKHLNTELAAKAGALQTQLETLYGSLDQLTTAQRQSLADQLSTNFQSLEAEVAARRQSLATALDEMRGAVGVEADARRAALSTELEGLNAAQAPLNAAREQGAKALVTAVSLGLESTRDQITAKAAQDGYIGSSSATEGDLARAGIMARQQGASAVADARVANAADTARIGQYGATKGAGIAENAAAAMTGVANYGATEGRAVSDYNASGVRTITDYGAAQTRGISDTAAGTRFDIASYGAGEQRGLTNYGAEQTRATSDYGVTEARGIRDAASSRTLGYFDQDLQRRLAALSLPTAALNTELQLKNTVDEYGQSGLKRTMNNLGFFADTPSAAPTAAPYYQQPVQNGYENLGAGLLAIGGSIANANNWWSVDRSGVGAKTSYSDFIKNNPTSGAATGSYMVPGGTGAAANVGNVLPRIDQGSATYSAFGG